MNAAAIVVPCAFRMASSRSPRLRSQFPRSAVTLSEYYNIRGQDPLLAVTFPNVLDVRSTRFADDLRLVQRRPVLGHFVAPSSKEAVWRCTSTRRGQGCRCRQPCSWYSNCWSSIGRGDGVTDPVQSGQDSLWLLVVVLRNIPYPACRPSSPDFRHLYILPLSRFSLKRADRAQAGGRIWLRSRALKQVIKAPELRCMNCET